MRWCIGIIEVQNNEWNLSGIRTWRRSADFIGDMRGSGGSCAQIRSDQLRSAQIRSAQLGSPAFCQRDREQGLGQLELLVLHGVVEHLSVGVEAIGLGPQLKQLPDGHAQRPATHRQPAETPHGTAQAGSTWSTLLLYFS